MALSSGQKEQLLEQFGAYLDEPDTQPDGPTEVDLYTLFTELAAVKTEVKIESRQVKAALEEFKGLTDLLRDNNDQLNTELSRRHRDEKQMRQEIERPLLLELLEMRDRINDGVLAAQTWRPSLLRRRSRRQIASLRSGMEISLRRLDTLLTRYRVKAVDTVGCPLDPHCMQVTGAEENAEYKDGIVLAEERRGYLRGDQLLRSAEVVVNKRSDS